MSIANDALLLNLGLNGFPVVDALISTATTQATATRCTGQVNRFIKIGAAGDTAVLPSVNSLEAQGIVFVVNDDASSGGPFAMNVWPQGAETINGANAAVSIPAGQSGIFIAATAAKISKGGGRSAGSFTNDWRFAVIP